MTGNYGSYPIPPMLQFTHSLTRLYGARDITKLKPLQWHDFSSLAQAQFDRFPNPLFSNALTTYETHWFCPPVASVPLTYIDEWRGFEVPTTDLDRPILSQIYGWRLIRISQINDPREFRTPLPWTLPLLLGRPNPINGWKLFEIETLTSMVVESSKYKPSN